MYPRPQLSYRQSSKLFQEDPEAAQRSANLAIKIVADAMQRGISLQDIVRKSLPRLSIHALENVLSLGRKILSDKHETAERYGTHSGAPRFTQGEQCDTNP